MRLNLIERHSKLILLQSDHWLACLRNHERIPTVLRPFQQ